MEDKEEKQEEGMPNTKINTDDIEKAVEIAKEIIEKKKGIMLRSTLLNLFSILST